MKKVNNSTEVTKKLSRREVILGAGMVILGQSLASALPKAPFWNASASGSAHSVSLLPASSPAFGPTVERLFPGLASQSGFQAIRSMTFLLQHKSGPGVRAFSVTLAITNPSGVQETSLFFYSQTTVNSLMSGKRHLLRKGRSRLVSPFFNWQPDEYTRVSTTLDWDAMLNQNKLRKLVLQQAKTATEIHVQLDAVVFADWTVAGPDKTNLARHLMIRRNADHDEAVSLLRAIRAGATRAQLAAKLRQHQKIEGIAGGPIDRAAEPDRYWYFRARTIQARSLLRRFKRTKKGAFARTLAAITNTPKTKIVAVSA
jgi:hypothetical protein